MKKRIVSLFMALVMTLSLLPNVWAMETDQPAEDTTPPATEQTAEAEAETIPVTEPGAESELTEDNGFLLLAATGNRVVIEPERVAYQSGDTVAQALARTSHIFTGLDTSGFITAINGVDASYNRYDDQGGYALDQSAAGIRAFVFVTFSLDGTQLQEQAAALYEMADQMLAWQKADAPVQNYARQAYDAARTALMRGGNFAALRDALRDKMAEYEEFLKAQKYPLTLALQDLEGSGLAAYTFTAENLYGTVSTFAPGDTLALAAGDYTFTLTSGYSGATGTMTVQEGGTVTVGGKTVEALRVPLNQEWIAQPKLLSRLDGDPETDTYSLQDDQAHTSTALLPDTVAARGAVYLYAIPGADAPNGVWNGGDLALYASYDAVTGKQESVKRAWLSNSDSLADIVQPGVQGNTLLLEARAVAEDGYTLYQTWTVALERTPTLSSLLVTADGIAQNIGFSGTQTQYDCTVTSDTVVLTPGVFLDAYTVTVNGDRLTGGSYTLALAENDTTEARVTVTMENGRANTYTVSLTRVPAVAVAITCDDKDTTLEIRNSAGAEIGSGADGRYALIPGGDYVYVATKAEYYHTTGTFTAKEGLAVSVTAPSTEDHLSSLTLGSSSQAGNGDQYLLPEQFRKDTHTYEAWIGDVYETLYAWAGADTGCSVAAIETDGGQTAIPAGRNYGVRIGNSVSVGAERQTLTIRVSYTEGAVQQYQDYLVTFHKKLMLADESGIKLTVDGTETALYQVVAGQVTEESYFDSEVYDYRATVVRSAETAVLTVTLPYGGNTVRVNDTPYPVDTNAETGEPLLTATITLALDNRKGEEVFTVTAYSAQNPDARPCQYAVTIKKGDPIATAITVVDQQGKEITDALAAVYDGRSGSRIWPEENGRFLLVDGLPYTYVVTCAGYVSETDTFRAAAQKNSITVTLTAAPQTDHGANVTSPWPSFRGRDDYNGVVDHETPITRDTAVLSWANQLGDGYSQNAVGSPILITEGGVDYLITYSKTTLYKVEAITGTVVATGTMYCGSNFAITPPTYGGGMLFMALQDGTVQAFDAATLESLWLYQDPLKGQANSPITYYDGYVYTGFWNSETNEANYVCLSATDEDPGQPLESKLARWTYTSVGGFYWAGAYVCNDYLLVGTDDGDSSCTSPTAALLCIDPKTGAVLDKLENLKGDIRSSIAESNGRFYFTTKGGCFYSVSMNGTAFDKSSLKKVSLTNGAYSDKFPAMSTCTPVVYNGRAYVGVSGTSQFGAYSGHNITVIDLSSWSIAYTVPTMGYPQTSGLLTTAYGDSAYVYFFDNYTPGKLRLLKDKPGQHEAELITQETYTVQGSEQTVDAAYALFTPAGAQAQYAICSPISDEYGTLYFKNDSACLMALTNIVTAQITKLPTKTTYQAGETFDPSGMEITLTYANGKTRTLPVSRTINGKTIQYFTWKETVTEEDTDFSIYFVPVMYSSAEDGKAVEETAPATLSLTVTPAEHPKGDINGDGTTDVYDLQRLYEHCSGIQTIGELELLALADVNSDKKVDINDVQCLYAFLTTGEWVISPGGHAITVKSTAPETAETKQGQAYTLPMDEVFTTCDHSVTYTLDSGDHGPQTKLALNEKGWYLSYANPSMGDDTLTITAVCDQDKTVKAVYTLAVIVTEGEKGDPAQYGYNETNASSVKVYVTISNDGVPIIGNDRAGTVLSHLEVNVPYFDLKDYDLEAFYRYHTEDGSGPYVDDKLIQRPTLLHLYLYLLGVYCQGYTPQEVISGQAEIVGADSNHQNYQDLLEKSAPSGWGTFKALNITGSPTSLYMEQFWGHDQNLMYYRNHMYPLMSPGWGSTADYILLSDGDTIDLAMFSNWSFWSSGGAFACFNKDEYTASTGTELSFSTQKYATQSVADGGDGAMTPISGLNVYVYDADWNPEDVVSSEGPDYEYTFKKPGTYYLLAVDPNAGTYDACIAPATARVTVS